MSSKSIFHNPTVEEYLKEPDVHEVRKAGVIGATLTLFVALIATFLHAFNTYLLFWLEYPLVVAFLIHVILSGGVLIFAAILHKLERDARFMLLLGVTTAGLGVFGAGGTVISIVLYIFFMRGAQTFSEWFASIFPRAEQTRPEELYEDIEYGRDRNPLSYSVIPFLDIMSIGSEAQKRRALSRMTEYFDPRFAPGFQRALHDKSNTIRVQAATAVTRIENQFHDELMKIKGLVNRFPKDANIRLALAEHYDDYAFTGVLDEEREKLNRQRAIEHYREYLDMKPNDVNVRIRLGRVMLRNKMFMEAADWFKDSVDQGFSSDSMMIWYLESLYAAERYNDLRKMAGMFRSRLEPYYEEMPQLAESVKLWAGQSAPEMTEKTS